MTNPEQEETEEKPSPISEKQKFIGQTIDNQLCGVMEFYDDEENLIANQTFDKGLLQGESFKYDQFHKITEKLTYQAGKLEGPAEFYNNGTPLLQTHFSEGKQKNSKSFRVFRCFWWC